MRFFNFFFSSPCPRISRMKNLPHWMVKKKPKTLGKVLKMPVLQVWEIYKMFANTLYRYFLLSITDHISFSVARTDCAVLQHQTQLWALSMDSQLHTHSSPHLRQGQHPMISTSTYKLPIAEIYCIVVCSLHARCPRIIYKLPIAEIHSVTV